VLLFGVWCKIGRYHGPVRDRYDVERMMYVSRSLDRSLSRSSGSYGNRAYGSRTYRTSYRRRRYLKRRQQVRRQIILMGCFLILLTGLAANYYVRKSQMTAEVHKMVRTEEGRSNRKVQQITIEEETEEEKIARVRRIAQEKGYPESVTELLDKNPETVNFVAHYEEKMNEPAAETIDGDLVQGQIPKLYQWDERWGYSVYGTSIVAVSGCGPTCMAMVASGLLNDPTITPAKVAAYAMENGYIDENNDTYWRFMKEASANWNISCYDGQLTEEQVRDELEQGHPIICTVGPGNFTQNGHFIVLTQYADGKVRVNDPFSLKNTDTEWVFAEIAGQIKAMWVYSME